jgi:hypothetical protein
MKTIIISILSILGVYQLEQLRNTNLQAFAIIAGILAFALIVELVKIYWRATR